MSFAASKIADLLLHPLKTLLALAIVAPAYERIGWRYVRRMTVWPTAALIGLFGFTPLAKRLRYNLETRIALKDAPIVFSDGDGGVGERWILAPSAWRAPRAYAALRTAAIDVAAWPVDRRTDPPPWPPLHIHPGRRFERLDRAFREVFGLAHVWALGRTDAPYRDDA